VDEEDSMTYLMAFAAGIVAAVAGWFVTGALTAYVAGLFGMSDFEGGRGMFAFLAVGPIGGLIAMVGSVWLVLRRGGGSTPMGQTLARLAAVLGAIALVAGAAIWVRLATLDVYTDSLPPVLEFEIRVAGSERRPDAAAPRVELHTDRNVGEGLLSKGWAVGEDGGMTISGRVDLAFKTYSRLLVVSMPGEPARLFHLRLSRDPRSTVDLGAWRRPDHIHVAGEEQPRAAPADDPVEVRYRVRRARED
jgi:hypothetical protein